MRRESASIERGEGEATGLTSERTHGSVGPEAHQQRAQHHEAHAAGGFSLPPQTRTNPR